MQLTKALFNVILVESNFYAKGQLLWHTTVHTTCVLECKSTAFILYAFSSIGHQTSATAKSCPFFLSRGGRQKKVPRSHVEQWWQIEALLYAFITEQPASVPQSLLGMGNSFENRWIYDYCSVPPLHPPLPFTLLREEGWVGFGYLLLCWLEIRKRIQVFRSVCKINFLLLSVNSNAYVWNSQDL